VPATWPALQDALARIVTDEARGGLVSRFVWPCRCVREGGLWCEDVPPDEICGIRWSRCPWPYLRSGPWAQAQALDRLSEVGPIYGWPYLQPAWLALAVLKQRQIKAQAQEAA